MTIGTRPEFIRLSTCIKACDKYFNHILIHIGQELGLTLNEVFFKDLGLRTPDYYLDSIGKDFSETMGNIVTKSYDVILKERPYVLLILGNTNSLFAAISAKRLKYLSSTWKLASTVGIGMYIK